MPTLRSALVFAGLAAAYALAAVAYTAFPAGTGDADDFSTGLKAIGECTNEANGTMCARPAVVALLETHSGEEITRAIDAQFTPQQCHYMGHVVGQESYNKLGDVEAAIEQCGRDCDSACIHGVIGEAFAEELGLGSSEEAQDIDLAHLDPEQMKVIGSRLCVSPTACHGVGHALFQIYGRFEPALEMCREVTSDGWKPNFCYQGAFMEYADILSSRNARPIDGIGYPTLNELVQLCDLPTMTEVRACFRYFPRMVVQTLKHEGVSLEDGKRRLLEICLAYLPEKRHACIAGFGVYSAYNILTDTAEAVRICHQFDSVADQAACSLGITSVATEERQGRIMAYCMAIPDTVLQEYCFHDVFYYLNRLRVPRAASRRLCNGLPACEAQADRYAVDAWDEGLARYMR